MRDLMRNRQEIYCALRNVTQESDGWGNTTDVTGYSSPFKMSINISGDKGEAAAQAFGADLKYDREMVTHDMACPLDEYSRLWVDGRPTTETHNYEVVAVSKTLNCIRYAIRRVNVSR